MRGSGDSRASGNRTQRRRRFPWAPASRIDGGPPRRRSPDAGQTGIPCVGSRRRDGELGSPASTRGRRAGRTPSARRTHRRRLPVGRRFRAGHPSGRRIQSKIPRGHCVGFARTGIRQNSCSICASGENSPSAIEAVGESSERSPRFRLSGCRPPNVRIPSWAIRPRAGAERSTANYIWTFARDWPKSLRGGSRCLR